MEHLALIERAITDFPSSMLEKSKVSSKFFSGGKSRWRSALDKDGCKHVRKMKELHVRATTRRKTTGRGADVCVLEWMTQEIFAKDGKSGLTEVIQGLLVINPKDRCTAEQALAMPFFQQGDQPSKAPAEPAGSSSRRR